MYRYLKYLLSFALVVGLAGTASAWTGVTVGDDMPLGSNTYDEATGTFTIEGDGHDIWDNADDFRYVYKYLLGDGAISARVTDIGTGSNGWAKSGVMMREDLTGESRHSMMIVTAGEGGGASFQRRMTTGGGGANDDAVTTIAPPYYVMIERSGDDFTGYVSEDGESWTQQGTTITLPIRYKTGEAGCYIGLCMTSHATGELRTTTIDNVVLQGNITDAPPAVMKAWAPDPPDGATGVMTPLFQWSAGDTALFHDVYFGTSPDLTEADLKGPRQPFNLYYHVMGLEPGVTYYWRVDEIESDMVTVHTGNVWTATATPLSAWAPSPADAGEGVFPAATLKWTSGLEGVEHHVYFADNAADVEARAAGADQGILDTTEFTTPLLRSSTAYYWMVDEIEADGTVREGEVWSFVTSEGVSGKVVRDWWLNNTGVAVAGLTSDPRYPGSPDGSELLDLFEGPTDWSDNYGTRLYGWLVPPESGDYTFWIASDDGSELWLSTDADPANGVLIASVSGWTPARDFDNTGGGVSDADAQESDPIALVAGQKYSIEALMNEGGGGDNIAVAWQAPGGAREVIPGQYVDTFAFPALTAFAPDPANRAVDTAQDLVLGWTAGENATQHQVYFSDDADAVAAADTSSAEYKGQQAGTVYNPGALEWGKAYAWRVDEIEGDGTIRVGRVWTFTTAAFLPIEGFEGYTDNMDDGEAVFQTWIDGWENGTTSVVGYLQSQNGTFNETTIVHSGKQSMPLEADNANAPSYGETSRTFAPARNLTVNGMDTLTLYVRGQTTNSQIPLYIGLKSGATRVNVLVPNDVIAQAISWQEVNIPLADFAPVNAAAVNEMFISLGNPDAPTPGGLALIYVDDIRATLSGE